MSDQPELPGRVYHLRTRLLPFEPPRVVNLTRPPSKPLATVHALPSRHHPDELLLTGAITLDYAWAAHQRVYGARGGVSFRRVLSGALRGSAEELLKARRHAQALPDRADWMETLQYAGRAVLQVFESITTYVPLDDHDCDCTCVHEDGHSPFVTLPEAWRAVRVGALLVDLARGRAVRVRLA